MNLWYIELLVYKDKNYDFMKQNFALDNCCIFRIDLQKTFDRIARSANVIVQYKYMTTGVRCQQNDSYFSQFYMTQK